jgi:hypothetical protein
VQVVNWAGLALVLATLAVTSVGALVPLAYYYGPWYCRYCGAPFSSEAEGAAHSRAVHGQQ